MNLSLITKRTLSAPLEALKYEIIDIFFNDIYDICDRKFCCPLNESTKFFPEII
jgi:hypothetical protein